MHKSGPPTGCKTSSTHGSKVLFFNIFLIKPALSVAGNYENH